MLRDIILNSLEVSGNKVHLTDFQIFHLSVFTKHLGKS